MINPFINNRNEFLWPQAVGTLALGGFGFLYANGKTLPDGNKLGGGAILAYTVVGIALGYAAGWAVERSLNKENAPAIVDQPAPPIEGTVTSMASGPVSTHEKICLKGYYSSTNAQGKVFCHKQPTS